MYDSQENFSILVSVIIIIIIIIIIITIIIIPGATTHWGLGTSKRVEASGQLVSRHRRKNIHPV